MTKQPTDFKALILAAGLGTRLRPITDHIAKPALPFFGSTILNLWLNKLAKLKMPLAINTHHLPEQIHEIAKDVTLEHRVTLSHEPDILGTGGALRKLDEWRGQSSILLCNADIISALDIDAFLAKHLAAGNAATLCLLRTHRAGTTPVYADDREVVGIGKIERATARTPSAHTYACAMLLSAPLVAHIPTGVHVDIWPAIRAAFAQNLSVGAFFFDGFWADVGTPLSYWQTCKEFLQRVCDNNGAKFASSLGLSSWQESLVNKSRLLVLPGTAERMQNAYLYGPAFVFGYHQFPSDLKLGPNSAIFGSCTIGDNATIKNSLLLPGTEIDAGESLEDVIAFAKTRVSVDAV